MGIEEKLSHPEKVPIEICKKKLYEMKLKNLRDDKDFKETFKTILIKPDEPKKEQILSAFAIYDNGKKFHELYMPTKEKDPSDEDKSEDVSEISLEEESPEKSEKSSESEETKSLEKVESEPEPVEDI